MLLFESRNFPKYDFHPQSMLEKRPKIVMNPKLDQPRAGQRFTIGHVFESLSDFNIFLDLFLHSLLLFYNIPSQDRGDDTILALLDTHETGFKVQVYCSSMINPLHGRLHLWHVHA